MASRDRYTSEFNVTGQLADIATEFAPLILAALARVGFRTRVDPSMILTVIVEARGVAGLKSMTWSELQGLVIEAVGIGNVDWRRWHGRSISLGIPMMGQQLPRMHYACSEAVADETLGALAERRWQAVARD